MSETLLPTACRQRSCSHDSSLMTIGSGPTRRFVITPSCHPRSFNYPLVATAIFRKKEIWKVGQEVLDELAAKNLAVRLHGRADLRVRYVSDLKFARGRSDS